jgi:hypothetical protein
LLAISCGRRAVFWVTRHGRAIGANDRVA